MKKLIICVLMMMSLVGCGGDDAPAVITEPPVVTPPVEQPVDQPGQSDEHRKGEQDTNKDHDKHEDDANEHNDKDKKEKE